MDIVGKINLHNIYKNILFGVNHSRIKIKFKKENSKWWWGYDNIDKRKISHNLSNFFEGK